jgi:hypothetical protein
MYTLKARQSHARPRLPPALQRCAARQANDGSIPAGWKRVPPFQSSRRYASRNQPGSPALRSADFAAPGCALAGASRNPSLSLAGILTLAGVARRLARGLALAGIDAETHDFRSRYCRGWREGGAAYRKRERCGGESAARFRYMFHPLVPFHAAARSRKVTVMKAKPSQRVRTAGLNSFVHMAVIDRPNARHSRREAVRLELHTCLAARGGGK